MSDTTISDPPPTPPPLSQCIPLDLFRIFQHNWRGRYIVFLSFCSIVRSYSPSIPAVQDVFLINGKPPRAPGFVSLYNSQVANPRVVFYVQADFAAVHVFSIQTFKSPFLIRLSFQLGQTSLRLLNVYNLSWNPTEALRPGRIFTTSPTPTLILGDFNPHHPSANPTRFFTPRELQSSEPYFEGATITGCSLINSPGVATFHPSFQDYRPSVLDLAFANQAFLSLHPQWDNNLPPTGSEYTAPSTTIWRIDANPSLPSPNWDAIDWDIADPDIKGIILPPPP